MCWVRARRGAHASPIPSRRQRSHAPRHIVSRLRPRRPTRAAIGSGRVDATELRVRCPGVSPLRRPSLTHRAHRRPACDSPHPEPSRAADRGAGAASCAVASTAGRVHGSAAPRRYGSALSDDDRPRAPTKVSSEEVCSRLLLHGRSPSCVEHNDLCCARGRNPRCPEGDNLRCAEEAVGRSHKGSSENH